MAGHTPGPWRWEVNLRSKQVQLCGGLRRDRSRYHLTLGGLLDKLNTTPSDAPVVFNDGAPVGKESSYRGYYSDLAFATGTKPTTVARLLKKAKAAIGKTYEGYKGGDYVMERDTPLWRGEYGCCGPAIVDARFIDGKLVLITKDLDD